MAKKKQIRKLNWPLKEVRDSMHPELKILWMLFNNEYCHWSDFRDPRINVSSGSMSTYMKRLIKEHKIERLEDPGISYNFYKITMNGRERYFDLMQNIEEDPMLLLNLRIGYFREIYLKTKSFIEEIELIEESVVRRFRKYLSFFDYSTYETIYLTELNYYNTILYLAYNHPDERSTLNSFDWFCSQRGMDVVDLRYIVKRLVEEDKYSVKIFNLNSGYDNNTYFIEGDKVEMIIKSVAIEELDRKFDEFIEESEDTSSEYKILIEPEDLETMANTICFKYEVLEKEWKQSIIEFLRDKYITRLKYEFKLKEELEPTETPLDMMEAKQEDELDKEVNLLQVTSKRRVLLIPEFRSKCFDDYHYSLLDKIDYHIDEVEYEKAEAEYKEHRHILSPLEREILEDIIASSQENYRKSLKTTDSIIKSNRNHFVGYYLKSLTLSDMNQHRAALKQMDKALKLDPDLWFLYFHKSILLSKVNRAEEASELFKIMISKNPMVFLSSFSKGIRDFNKLKVVKPLKLIGSLPEKEKNPFYYLLQTILEVQHTNLKDALVTINDGIKLFPNIAGLRMIKALILTLMKRYEDAVSPIYVELERMKNQAENLLYEIIMHMLLEDFDLLREKIARVRAENKQLPDSYYYMAQLLMLMDMNKEALDIAEKLKMKKPRFSELHIKLKDKLKEP